ncbi:hypothetical protein CCR95_17890 [Thiocystis minor]|nr:hypothetical protein [Thiocystis minor]
MNRLRAENQRLQEQLTRKAAALDRALDRMGDLALPRGAGAQHWFKIDASVSMDRTARVAVFCGGGFMAKKPCTKSSLRKSSGRKKRAYVFT